MSLKVHRILSLAVLLMVFSAQWSGNAQSVPCVAITRNPLVLESLLDSTDTVPDLEDDTIHASELEWLQFQPIVIQPGDALYVEYRGKDFTISADFANGDRAVFGPSRRNDEQWHKGILLLDAFRDALQQRLVRLRVAAMNPNQVLLRNIRIIRAGRPVFEFTRLASYGKPRVKKAVNHQLPCVPFDEAASDPNPRAVDYAVPGSIAPKGLSGDYVRPLLPPFPMMQGTTTNPDGNHYKFTGKELDDESGLYNYGARYYGPGLGRYLSPDWAARPTAIPYANIFDPQTLNLYSFGRNNPLSMRDPDGHCPGDDCKNVKVEVKVTDPAKIVKNEKQPGGDYATGVRANVQYTITEKGEPLSNTAVSEKNTATRTLNGEQRPGKLEEQNSSTNSQGQVNDTFGLLAHSDTPLTAKDNADFVDVLNNNNVTLTGTQTLTFKDQEGTTCSCTVDRTLTNENKDGTNNGSTYNLTTSQPSAAKPVEQPKEKKPQ